MPGKRFFQMCFLVSVSFAPAFAGESSDFWDIIFRSEEQYRQVSDYTCKMHRTELIGDKYKVQKYPGQI
jgi:hypothetical protein